MIKEYLDVIRAASNSSTVAINFQQVYVNVRYMNPKSRISILKKKLSECDILFNIKFYIYVYIYICNHKSEQENKMFFQIGH